MAKLQILHIGKYYDPFKGGIENFLRDLLESEIVRQGCDNWVLAHHHETRKPTETDTINGVTVTRVQLWKRLVFAPICPGFFDALKQTLRQQQPDIIHIHMPNVSAFACLLSSDAKQRPWVIHWHADVLGATPDWRVKLLYPVYRLFERALLKRAATIICTSPPYLETSKALAGFKHKCTVVPLGIRDFSAQEVAEIMAHSPIPALNSVERGDTSDTPDTPAIADSPATPDTPERSRPAHLKLLCIGRLTYYKGHTYLLQAIADLPEIQLDIIGTGELQASLESQLNALELGHRVHLFGHLSDAELNRAISACDLVCLPSIERTEAFGLILLEAARLKKPALVTNVQGSGMSWVVQHERTGWVVDAACSAALREQLSALVSSPEQLKACGHQAHIRFQEQFGISAVGKAVCSVYDPL